MKTRTKQKGSATAPESLHGRAMDNLEFIRDTMQRSKEFTAVPGYGGVMMGVTACGAAFIAGASGSLAWATTWMVEGLLAVMIGLFAMWQKAKSLDESLRNAPAKKFALGFVPPLAAGALLTGLFVINGLYRFLPTVWLSLYGTAVITGGAYSVRIVPLMGWLFIGLAAVSVILPGYGNWLMMFGFGVLHIIFGLLIGRKYGG